MSVQAEIVSSSEPAPTTEGQGRPFFDPDKLPPIEDIDLSAVSVTGEAARIPATTESIKPAVKFLIEASVGTDRNPDAFEQKWAKAVGRLQEPDVGDTAFAVLERLDKENPRLPTLLDRARVEKVLSGDRMVLVNRLALLAISTELDESP